MVKSQEISVKSTLLAVFFLFFVCGIIAANLFGIDSTRYSNGLTLYYFKQFQFAQLDMEDLFYYIADRRLKLFAVLILASMLRRDVVVHIIFSAWCGFTYGYFCVILLGCMGAKGLLICLAALFPQFICYVPSYIGLVRLTAHKDESGICSKSLYFLLIIAGMAGGILLESYINPIVLQKMLKIF